ncbi:MAG: phage baseplate assembly protein V [Bacteroidota bacterium]
MADANDNCDVGYELLFDGKPYKKGFVGLSVTSAINKIPKARLEFNFKEFATDECGRKNYTITPSQSLESAEEEKPFAYHPGTEIVIKLGWDDVLQEVFKGRIVRHQLAVKNDGMQVLTLECKHAANLMTLSEKTRMLHQDAGLGQQGDQVASVDDDSILEQLVADGESGLNLKVVDQPQHAFKHENMVQYNCSDWDFLVMRAEATARVCFVSGDEISLLHPGIDEPLDFEIKVGKNLLEYEAALDETLVYPNVTMNSWETDEQELQETKENAVNLDPKGSNVRAYAIFNYAGDLTVNESRSWIKNEIERNALARTMSTAKLTGTVKVTPGDTINLSAFATGWKGKAFVSGIRHDLKKGTWHTYVQCGLTDKKHAEIYQLQQVTSNAMMPSVSGLHYGKVVDYKTSEGGHELLEVELPTANESEQNQTVYARLASFLAGQNGGAVFRPYPGDEVVMGFIGGDPRFPVVLGVLFNSQDVAPLSLKNNEQQAVGLCLNDWKIVIDEEVKTMSFTSPDGQQLVIDDQDKSILMSHDDQNSIKISREGIAMAATKITLTGKQGVEVEGAKIAAKADTELTLESGLSLSLEGKVSAKLKGQITQIN